MDERWRGEKNDQERGREREEKGEEEGLGGRGKNNDEAVSCDEATRLFMVPCLPLYHHLLFFSSPSFFSRLPSTFITIRDFFASGSGGAVQDHRDVFRKAH